MTHSYRSHYFHLIWSVKNRNNWIVQEIQPWLYAYIGGIIKNDKNILLSIGGMADHIHLLISFNSVDKFSSLIRDIKAKSTLWVHDNFPQYSFFSWQEGYASFSVSHSSLDKVMNYIENQEQHHTKFTFEEEYLQLLKKHNLKFDERFVLG